MCSQEGWLSNLSSGDATWSHWPKFLIFLIFLISFSPLDEGCALHAILFLMLLLARERAGQVLTNYVYSDNSAGYN